MIVTNYYYNLLLISYFIIVLFYKQTYENQKSIKKLKQFNVLNLNIIILFLFYFIKLSKINILI